MSGRHHHEDRISTDVLHACDDHGLLTWWLDGHGEALDELALRHHGWMLRLVRQHSIGERDPESVVQDAWLDVMRSAASFRGDGSVRGWLATIVRRRVVTTWRARGARPQTVTEFLPENLTAPDEFEDQVALQGDLTGLLGRLPSDQGEAIWWVDVVGLPVEDAAIRLGIPAGTVKSRCHRGRTRLRLILDGTS